MFLLCVEKEKDVIASREVHAGRKTSRERWRVNGLFMHSCCKC